MIIDRAEINLKARTSQNSSLKTIYSHDTDAKPRLLAKHIFIPPFSKTPTREIYENAVASRVSRLIQFYISVKTLYSAPHSKHVSVVSTNCVLI